jgi:nitroreductase
VTNETLETLRRLRTIHWDFDGRRVSDDDLTAIIEHGMRAANATNLANYSVVVVDDEDVMRRIVGNSGPARCCVFCVDFTRMVDAAKSLGYDYTPGAGWYAFVAWLYDVYALVQTAVIAAKAMGIDSLITNGLFRVDVNEVKRLLKLPEQHCFPVMAVLFGYGDKPEGVLTGRPPAKQVIHFGEYRRADAAAIAEFVAAMDRIYPEYVSDKYAHALDWYFNEWLVSYGGPDEHDVRLHEALRQSGFDL